MIPSCISSLSPSPLPTLHLRPQSLTLNPQIHRQLLHNPHLRPTTLSTPLRRPPPPLSGDSSAPLLHLDDVAEKDWSFLDSDPAGDRAHKARRIIAAGEVRRGSKVLVSMGTAEFVDQLVDSAPCDLVLAIHESLFTLAMVKESHDEVRCWQGGIDAVPERFALLDVVFLCYFPGMGVSLDLLLSSLAARCSAGARLVISFDQGRDMVEQHQQQYPDMVTSGLPHRSALQEAATAHSLQITEFFDEPTFYLAVLRFSKNHE